MSNESQNRPGAGKSECEPPVSELSVLDPTAEADRFDDTVAGIMDAARPELARRERREDPLVSVAAWWPAVLRAASIVAVVSTGVLLGVDGGTGSDPAGGGAAASPDQLAAALGVPDALSRWVGRDELPEPGALILTVEADDDR